jgi:hypothetical protein
MAANEAVPARRLRTAAASLTAGYAVLLASLVIRFPLVLTVLLPLGAALVAVGVALWLRAVVAEARAKGMV